MKSKILILQNELSAYNVPVYNEISNHYDLTVGYYLNDKSNQICLFKKHLFSVRRFKSMVIVKGVVRFAKDFDLVCIAPNMHVINYCFMPYLRRKFKVVNWSIGFRASYLHPYKTRRKHTFLDKIFQSILTHCDASIFYMEKAKEFWKGTSLDMNRVFIAPNTTAVEPIDIIPEKKQNLLFVGTLYREKGLLNLLNSVKEVVEKGIENVHLIIIGDGECRKELEDFVRKHQLSDNVCFTGSVFNEIELSRYFSEALLCISPNQAGLTCPKSMGYGVPFVTSVNAITGGEIFHITPNKNGLLYSEDKELTTIVEDACKNPRKYIQMGYAARDYYNKNATIKHMASGAMAAFKFALEG